MAFSEVVALAAADVQHPDGAVFDRQRNGHLGADVFRRLDVAGIRLDFTHPQRLPGLRYRAHQALPQAEAPMLRHVVGKPNGKAEIQLAAEVVQQQDAEGVVLDLLLDPLGHFAEDGVQLRGRVQVFGHPNQEAHRGRFVGLAFRRADDFLCVGQFVSYHFFHVRLTICSFDYIRRAIVAPNSQIPSHI